MKKRLETISKLIVYVNLIIEVVEFIIEKFNNLTKNENEIENK